MATEKREVLPANRLAARLGNLISWMGHARSVLLTASRLHAQGLRDGTSFHDLEDRLEPYFDKAKDIIAEVDLHMDKLHLITQLVVRRNPFQQVFDFDIDVTGKTFKANTSGSDPEALPFSGFEAGDFVEVSQAENSNNNGVYTVASLVESGRGLTVSESPGTDNSDDETIRFVLVRRNVTI
jgi:hypothetical protein